MTQYSNEGLCGVIVLIGLVLGAVIGSGIGWIVAEFV